jgi:hypothetical protein
LVLDLPFPQGDRRASAGLGGAAGEFGGKPLRGAARRRPDRLGGPGRRIRIAVAALVESEDRRRPSDAPFRRGRHRQIAAHGRAAGKIRRRAACAPALFLFAPAHRQRALSDHGCTPTARFIRSGCPWVPAPRSRWRGHARPPPRSWATWRRAGTRRPSARKRQRPSGRSFVFAGGSPVSSGQPPSFRRPRWTPSRDAPRGSPRSGTHATALL